MTRAMILESSVPDYLWPKAIATATYLTNRLPTKKLEYQTPLDSLGAHKLILSSHYLPTRIFGCTVYIHLPKQSRDKLAPRALKCVFVGHGVHQKGYRCYDPIHKRVYTTMDCEFVETEYFYNHLRYQGARPIDDLSWLTSPFLTNSEDPPEQVGNTTEGPIVREPDLSHTISEGLSEHPEPEMPETILPTAEVRNQFEDMVETNSKIQVQEEELVVPAAQRTTTR